MAKFAKGDGAQVLKDRVRGGPVITGVSRFVKPELLRPETSRFVREPDQFRTNI